MDHESVDDPVKRGPVVVATLGKGLEVLDGKGRYVREEQDFYRAERRLKDGDFNGARSLATAGDGKQPHEDDEDPDAVHS